jgi:hypothetical protein
MLNKQKVTEFRGEFAISTLTILTNNSTLLVRHVRKIEIYVTM